MDLLILIVLILTGVDPDGRWRGADPRRPRRTTEVSTVRKSADRLTEPGSDQARRAASDAVLATEVAAKPSDSACDLVVPGVEPAQEGGGVGVVPDLGRERARGATVDRGPGRLRSFPARRRPLARASRA